MKCRSSLSLYTQLTCQCQYFRQVVGDCPNIPNYSPASIMPPVGPIRSQTRSMQHNLVTSTTITLQYSKILSLGHSSESHQSRHLPQQPQRPAPGTAQIASVHMQSGLITLHKIKWRCTHTCKSQERISHVTSSCPSSHPHKSFPDNGVVLTVRTLPMTSILESLCFPLFAVTL